MKTERAQHWDNIAKNMPDIFHAASTQYYRRREIALIQRHLNTLEKHKILKLDLWNEAVNTRIMNWLETQGAETYGLDISHITAYRALSNSSIKYESFRIVQADIDCIPFPDNSFDVVYAMGTIEHNKEYELSLSEIYRVLSPGGKAIIGVPHKWDIFLRPVFVGILDLFGKYLYSPERSMSANQLKRALQKSGFQIRNRTGLLLMPGFLRMLDLFFYVHNIPIYLITPILLWPFEKLESNWEWCRRFGYLLVIIAQK